MLSQGISTLAAVKQLHAVRYESGSMSEGFAHAWYVYALYVYDAMVFRMSTACRALARYPSPRPERPPGQAALVSKAPAETTRPALRRGVRAEV